MSPGKGSSHSWISPGKESTLLPDLLNDTTYKFPWDAPSNAPLFIGTPPQYLPHQKIDVVLINQGGPASHVAGALNMDTE